MTARKVRARALQFAAFQSWLMNRVESCVLCAFALPLHANQNHRPLDTQAGTSGRSSGLPSREDAKFSPEHMINNKFLCSVHPLH